MSDAADAPAPPPSGEALLLRLYYVASYVVGGIYLPFFPPWLEARGMSGLELGAICAAAPAMGLVAPSAFGVLADALGVRVGLLQVASAGALASFGALCGVLALARPVGFATLLVAALFIALFRSPMTMIADVVALETAPALGTTYGRLRLWGSLGFLGASLAASVWVDPRDALTLPLVCTAALGAGFASSLALPRRSKLPGRGARERHALSTLLAERDFQLLLLVVFLAWCGSVAYDMCFSLRLFALGVPRPVIGLAWAIGTGAEVVLMAGSAPMFRSHASPRLLAFALAGAAARWVLLSVVRSTVVLLLLQPLHALSFALVWLSTVSYTSQRFASRPLGTAQGLVATAVGAGSIVGMLLWGPVYRRGGGELVFRGAAGFAALAFLLAVGLARRAERGSIPRRRGAGLPQN